jgi:uncharacterized protein
MAKKRIRGLIILTQSTNQKEIRNFVSFEIRAGEAENENELYVEGYAATFNSPTVIWEFDGVQYKEQIDDRAFDEADMKDVIFNYDHKGKVMARTRNKTLTLSTDAKGLYIRARLDGTEEGRRLYEEIKGGYVDRMSFAFVAKEDAYDNENHMRTIRKIKKLYDVSAVSVPAYDDTIIAARNYYEAHKEAEQKQKEIETKNKLRLSTYL